MSRCAKRTGRLRVTQLVAIDTAARGVVHIVGSRTVVNREVDIRAICLGAHERCTLDAADGKRGAISRRNQRRSKVIIKVDNRQRRATGNLAADNQLVAIQRRHAGASRKTQVDDALFGNARSGIRITRTTVRNRQNVQLAIARNQISMATVGGEHTGGVNDSPNGNASKHSARRLAEHLNGTGAGGNQNKAVTHGSARPVITLIGVDVLPGNGTGQDIDARQMAVVIHALTIVDINGADIEIVAIDRQLRIRLSSFAHRVGNPNRRERIGRQSLDRTAIERDDDQAVRINRTRRVANRSLKIRLGQHLARLGIDLKQALVDGEIHIAVYDNRLARVGVRGARIGLPIKRPRACQRARRRGHVLDHRIGIAAPVGFPIGRARSARINYDFIGIRNGIASSISPDDLVTRLEHIVAIELRPRNAVDKERPSTRQLGAIKRRDKSVNAPITKLVVHLGLDANGIEVGSRGILDRRALDKHLHRRISPALSLIVLLADDLHRNGDLTRHGAVGAIDPSNLVACLKRIGARTNINRLAIDKELPIFPGVFVNLLAREGHVLFERRGQRLEIPAKRALPRFGANARLFKDLLGKVSSGCSLVHESCRRLCPRLPGARSILADNGAAYRKLIGRSGVVVLRVVPDDGVAGLERVAAGADHGGLAVDEQLPVRFGRRVVGERAAGVEGRRDRIERPAPGAVGVVVRLEAGLLEELLGEVGRGRALLQRNALSGGPGLLSTLSVGADDRTRRGNLRGNRARGILVHELERVAIARVVARGIRVGSLAINIKTPVLIAGRRVFHRERLGLIGVRNRIGNAAVRAIAIAGVVKHLGKDVPGRHFLGTRPLKRGRRHPVHKVIGLTDIVLAYAYNPDVNGKRLFVGRINEPSGALDIVVAGVCHDIGVFALSRGGKRDRAGRFVGAKQLVGICALSVIGEIPAVIDEGALGECRLVIAPIARCHVIGSRGKRSADLCKVAARSDINRCQGIRLGIFALDDGITRGGIVGVVATVDDALEVLADVLLRNYERRPVRVLIRQRRERTLGAIGNLPRIRQLIRCKLGTLCSCRRLLECSNTDLFATLVDKLGVIALIADDLFEIRQEQLVRACGLNGHSSSRLYGVIARSGRHAHPALGVVIGNRKAAVGFALDHMPVGLRIKRRGRRVDRGPTPRVGNALGNRLRRVIDRLVGARLNRRASVLGALARIGKCN